MDVDKFRRLADFVCRDEYIHSCFLFTLNGHFPAILSFFVLYVVWFLWLIQLCTHKHFQFGKQITVLVVPHWKELSTIRFEKKAGVNAGFANRMVAHKEHEILKNPIYTVLIRVHL